MASLNAVREKLNFSGSKAQGETGRSCALAVDEGALAVGERSRTDKGSNQLRMKTAIGYANISRKIAVALSVAVLSLSVRRPAAAVSATRLRREQFRQTAGAQRPAHFLGFSGTSHPPALRSGGVKELRLFLFVPRSIRNKGFLDAYALLP
ncbi:MAG: hypothetical protein ACLU98_04970 [Desulfovibrio fairfieldensis]